MSVLVKIADELMEGFLFGLGFWVAQKIVLHLFPL